MQAVHDYLLAMDDINRDLLVNGLLLLFDLLILALLLPSFIDWLEDRKWRAMRLSLLSATVDLLASAFVWRPHQEETYLDRHKYAELDDRVFSKLQLFASALTPAQSASVAAMVELSLDAAEKINAVRVNRAVVEQAMEVTTRRKTPRDDFLFPAAKGYNVRMLLAVLELPSLPVRRCADSLLAQYPDGVRREQDSARLDAIVAAVEEEIRGVAEVVEKLALFSPRDASHALSYAKAVTLLPGHFAKARSIVDDVFERWEREEAEASAPS